MSYHKYDEFKSATILDPGPEKEYLYLMWGLILVTCMAMMYGGVEFVLGSSASLAEASLSVLSPFSLSSADSLSRPSFCGLDFFHRCTAPSHTY